MKAKMEKDFKYDSEGKYAVQGMNLMRQQKTIIGFLILYLLLMIKKPFISEREKTSCLS
jgi:hypothetical protein